MDQRKLTVYAGSENNVTYIPQIILQGKWLQELGFCIGDKVTVDYKTGKIIITKEDTDRNNKME